MVKKTPLDVRSFLIITDMICLVDERISEKCERALRIRGFNVIRMPADKRLGEAVASHPDMLIFAHGNTLIANVDYCEKYSYIFTDIREFSKCVKMNFVSDTPGEKYPYDAIFNALVANGHIFYKEDTASRAVKDYAKEAGLIPISVKQGYPACTTLAFGGSAITADPGMKKALSEIGIKVSLIRNGDISLPPYEYGFIGGAAGVCGKEIYFLGNLDTHRDCALIREAILKEGYAPVSLSDEPLVDLGRIIFID